MTSTTQDIAVEKYTVTIDSSLVAKNYEDKNCISEYKTVQPGATSPVISSCGDKLAFCQVG